MVCDRWQCGGVVAAAAAMTAHMLAAPSRGYVFELSGSPPRARLAASDVGQASDSGAFAARLRAAPE